MSHNKPTRLQQTPVLTEGTPEALAFGGFDDDEQAQLEHRAPAVPEDVGFWRAVRLFYRHYWNSQGGASASEFWLALIWVVTGTVVYVGVTIWLNFLTLAEDAESLLRTLFMFLVITNPLWIAMNIGPTLTLIKRRRNQLRADRKS